MSWTENLNGIVSIPRTELTSLCRAMVQLGQETADKGQRFYTLKEAYQIAGESAVKTAIKNGELTKVKLGPAKQSTARISKQEFDLWFHFK